MLTLDKSNYAGLIILDLSKLLMHKFHYKYIRRKFNADLLFTDIGSLIYEIKTDDVYEKFYRDKNSFGFSDYLGDLKFFDFVEKKVIIKMKDKFKGKIIC